MDGNIKREVIRIKKVVDVKTRYGLTNQEHKYVPIINMGRAAITTATTF